MMPQGGFQRTSHDFRVLTAERERVIVLHYDGDYDLIAQVTGQSMEWVVPRGTVP